MAEQSQNSGGFLAGLFGAVGNIGSGIGKGTRQVNKAQAKAIQSNTYLNAQALKDQPQKIMLIVVAVAVVIGIALMFLKK